MNIILASEVIHPGGAETFILRLAQALKNKGHNVTVFVFYEQILNYDLCKILAPAVSIVPAQIPGNKILSKVDGLLFKLGIDFSVRNIFIRKSLKKLIANQKTDIIHSHLLKVDSLCLNVASSANTPVVHTIHGDYLQFYEKTNTGIAIPLLNYLSKAKNNLSGVAETVCISDKQINFFANNFNKETDNKISKIYNGYRANITESKAIVRQQLNIPETDFVYGMVSRGIPEKGWQTAIDAFILNNKPNTHLVLTGSGEYLTELSKKYSDRAGIHFTGHSDNPINWINAFDVGLLPSVYASESLPTVIIEYLYCNIPIIASDAGEINNMTGQGNTPAAIIIPIIQGTVNTKEFASAMLQYLEDKALYEEHAKNASVCYNMFDMDKCVAAYTHVYEQAINKSAKS